MKAKPRAKVYFESGVDRVHQASQIRVICEIRGCYIFRVYSCQLVAKILRVFVVKFNKLCALCYRRSTFVENPLQIHPFYAKQSQFTKCSNERKFFYNNEL